MKKEIYTAPEAQALVFGEEDVIRTSSLGEWDELYTVRKYTDPNS